MTVIENRIKHIEKKLEQMNSNFISLQNLILYITSVNETLANIDEQEETFEKITQETNKDIKQFRNHIPSTCTISDNCAHRLKKATIEILQIYMEKGKIDALNSIDMFINEAKRKCLQSAKLDNMHEHDCLNNMIYILNHLRSFINEPKNLNFRHNLLSELSSTEIWLDKYTTDDFYELLAPLCNITRLSILKVLTKGRKSYSQLERECNIEANLNYHLEKLLKVKYIIKETHQGKIKYSIHLNGLKVLKFLTELKSHLN